MKQKYIILCKRVDTEEEDISVEEVAEEEPQSSKVMLKNKIY